MWSQVWWQELARPDGALAIRRVCGRRRGLSEGQGSRSLAAVSLQHHGRPSANLLHDLRLQLQPAPLSFPIPFTDPGAESGVLWNHHFKDEMRLVPWLVPCCIH